MKLTPTLVCLVAAGLSAQVKPVVTPQASLAAPRTARPMLDLQPRLKADLLPAGKTQGQFHLTGLVRKDRTVVLRWANSEGEMPTEGVRIFRQKAGDSTWKDLTGSKPLGFLQGKMAEKRLKDLPDEERERILAYPFGNIQHDPGTRLRVAELPAIPAKGAPARGRDLTASRSLQQFRSLRAQGRLNRSDLKLLHLRADLDLGMAEILGLTYTDDPGKGQFRYKLQIALPEGGQVEVECPKTFDTQVPTPVPQPVTLTAASGNGEVLLNWDETPSEAVGGYNVFRAEGPSGPWKRLNTDPVKKVQLELEDPETTLRRAIGVQDAMVRMLRPLPEAARTPQKIREAHAQAVAQADTPGNLPTLSARTSKAVKEAVSVGRLRPGGLQAPKSLYTDSVRTAGNPLVNEKTYYYKVTAVDLGGQEQPLDTAPAVAGIPKDLEPPQVPGQPSLKPARSALSDLHAAQTTRIQDTRLVALNQSIAAKSPRALQPLTPFQLQDAPASTPLGKVAAPTPAITAGAAFSTGTAPGSLNLGEAKRQRRAALAATLPVGALQKLAQAIELRSNPDGTVPPAQLVWTPSPDADLKGYEIHRAVGEGAFAKVADAISPEWTDMDLQPGQFYRYAIASVDKFGNVSARSPEGRVEVRDSSLPGRLAVPQFTGQVAKDLPPSLPVRRFIRPADQILASGSLRTAKSTLQLSKATEPTVTSFRAPKTVTTPKAKTAVMGSSASMLGSAKAFAAIPAMDLTPAQASLHVKPVFKVITRSINPMLLAAAAPKEIHVVLEWAKPLNGSPLEYVIQQAPRRMEIVSVPRPTVAFQAGFKAFEALRGPSAGAAMPSTVLRPAAPLPVAPSAPAASSARLVTATPALHAVAARGLVADRDSGLRLAEGRKDFHASLVVKEGPGTFTRVSEAPVTTERFVVAFPADVAQYGGATFYFRIQAFTREFGHLVEGPLSAPIEVRLPDLVAPPMPAPGSLDLQEGTGGSLQVALGWGQDAAKDLAGTFVDRQPMTYTLVDGEAKPGVPSGPSVRLTSSPVAGTAWTDAHPTAGYHRYTLRSVDAAGNISEPQGFLDILVPGEPVPGAPTDLAIQGNRLVWKAASEAAGYTVWRSFSGQEDDYVCISGILGASDTAFPLPAQGTLHLRVVARSASGMNATASTPLVRTPF